MEMKQIIERLGTIKYVLDSETDTITDITIVLGNVKTEVESPQSEVISLAEKALDASFEQLANAFVDVRDLIRELSEIDASFEQLVNAFVDVRDLIRELSEIEANKDLPQVKKKGE